MRTLLKSLATLFATLPGVGVLATGLGVPPQVGMTLVFAGVIEALGVVSLLLVMINQDRIRRWSKSRITTTTSIIGIVSFVILVAYISSYFYCVVTVEPRGTVYYPLWNAGPVADIVSDAGGRAAAINMFGRYACDAAVKSMGDVPMIVTTACLLLLYAVLFASLTLFSALPAAWFSDGIPDPTSRAPRP